MRDGFAIPFPSRARAAAACVAVLLVLGGCGGGNNSDAPGDTRASDPPNLLTSAYIDKQVRGERFPGAVRTALRFWRDLQYQNYPEAYESLVAELRAEVPFARFVSAMTKARARAQFLVLPRVQSVERRGDRVAVLVLLQPGARPAVSDQPLALTLRRTSRGWQMAGDPGGLLGTPAGIRKPRPTETPAPASPEVQSPPPSAPPGDRP